MSALGNLRDTATRWVRRPYTYLTGEWERLAPREKRWVTVLASAVVIVTMLLGAGAMFTSLSDLEEGNADIREALSMIAKHKDEYLEAKLKSQSQESRIGTEPPQITADLEAAAREESVQIAESSERPTTPAGRRYVEHDVDLKFRDVDLLSFTKFLRRVETGPRLVFFTRLSIKHHFSETEKLDVEATATAFERVREDKSKKKQEGKKE